MSERAEVTTPADGAGHADAALVLIADEALKLRSFLRGLDAYGEDPDKLCSGLDYAARAAGLIGWLADSHMAAEGVIGRELAQWVAPELAKMVGAAPGGPQA